MNQTKFFGLNINLSVFHSNYFQYYLLPGADALGPAPEPFGPPGPPGPPGPDGPDGTDGVDETDGVGGDSSNRPSPVSSASSSWHITKLIDNRTRKKLIKTFDAILNSAFEL
jgi:hypothetical protein